MKTITIHDSKSGSSAAISVEYGFNCYEFKAMLNGQTVEVIDSDPKFAETGDRASGNGIPILFPYPNRIHKGKYEWEGTEYHIPEELAAYNQDNAIHGFCLDRPWRLIDSGEDYAVGQFQLSVDAPERLKLWPADCLIEVRYTVKGAHLLAEIRVENCGDKSLPWGFGTHPYFKLPLGNGSAPSRCLVDLDASEQWELVDCLPTGKRIPVPADKDLREGAYFDVIKLDDVYTSLAATEPLQCSVLDEQAGLQIVQRYNSIFREVVMFTPPGRDAICLEPYTCVTDAINLQQSGIDAGLQVLPVGESCAFQIDIALEEVVV